MRRLEGRVAIVTGGAGGIGAIVDASSRHAVHPRAGMGRYDATEAAIVSTTRTLAREASDRGVRVDAASFVDAAVLMADGGRR